MEFIEEKPDDLELRRFVDRYQYFDVQEPIFVKTVPNGKIECWIVLDGDFEVFSFQTGGFEESKGDGFYPMGNQVSMYRVSKAVKCLNIKLNLSVLALPFFARSMSELEGISVVDFIGEEVLSDIKQQHFLDGSALDVGKLDVVMQQVVNKYTPEKRLIELIEYISTANTNNWRVVDYANKLNMTTKTLERLIKKHTGLSPKELFGIVRFEKTTSFFKSTNAKRLIDALEFGYYDQSHFRKECLRLTGYNPKDFFSKLRLSANDMIFE